MTPRINTLLIIVCSCVPATAALVTRGPFLQSAGSDRMTLCWRTDEPTTSEVAIAAELNGGFSSTQVAGIRRDHAVPITGLSPGQKYFYRILGTPASGTAINLQGPNYWFRTAPSATEPSPAHIWVVGDSGFQFSDPITNYNAYLNQTSAAAKTTSAFLMLGDNAYDIGTDNQIQAAVFNRYATLLRNTPVWSAIGNHDVGTVPYPFTASTPYEAAFTFPSGGESGGVPSGSERYYSFNHGNIHFIALDTNTPGNSSDAPGGTYGMVDWLLDDLKACTADWIIAISHQGPYSKGSHDSDTELGMAQTRNHVIPLLESYGADLILYGHSHVYERSKFIREHYGNSSTWDSSTMLRQAGEGSELGSVQADGSFLTTMAAATGAYQKPSTLGKAGTAYAVVGASSTASRWLNGSTALVNPAPHVANQVSLNLLGSMVIEVDGGRLNAQYLDINGAVRDDFTIVKGSNYMLLGAEPITEAGATGIAFPVTRTGAINYAEQVPVSVDLISGPGVTPAQGIAEFAAGQTNAEVKFFPQDAGAETHFEARLLPTTKALQPGGALRSAYRISGNPQLGQCGGIPTPSPASIWYASRFGEAPTIGGWNSDDDGDGLNLLVEYALGGEPGRNDACLLPQGKNEGGSFIYRYIRPPGRTDLDYQVLGSADLSSWLLPALSDVNDGPVTALGEPRKVELLVGSPVKFVRMKIGLLP
jgi:hypothetical protein